MKLVHAGTYRKPARERLQPHLDEDGIQHEWIGKELRVAPGDMEKFGRKYGWGAEQLNLFPDPHVQPPPEAV